MEITEGIEVIDLALYLKKRDILVISDLQIGFEEYLAKQGVLVPRQQYKTMIDRLEVIFSKVGKVKEVIINGDLKHEFGGISKQEWKETMRLLDYLQRKCEKIVLVKGNHDTFVNLISKKKGIEVIDEYPLDNVIIMHGHKISSNIKNKKLIIIGHEHPAISLRENARVEKFKCFLKGKYNKSVLIVQPSFNPLIEGIDITKEDVLSPFLEKGLKNFEVFVVDEISRRTRYFGKLKSVVHA